MNDDLIIKYGSCTIVIYRSAHLTEITLSKFRKLIKLAADKWDNNPAEIKSQMLEMLRRENQYVADMSMRQDVFRPKDKEIERRVKKIEQYRLVVEAWDI